MEQTRKRFLFPGKEATRRELRDFGLIMAAAFAVVGTAPFLLHHHPFRYWTFPIVLLFLLFSAWHPTLLHPLYRGWMAFGAVLGSVNSRIILGIVFFVIVTPVALALRLFGKDLLALKFHKTWKSYCNKVSSDGSTDRSMRHQF